MSQELPNSNKPEEIDAVYIFSLLEKIIKKIGEFLIKVINIVFLIVKKVFIFLLFLINLVKGNLLIILIPAIIGFGIFYFLERNQPKIYTSNLLLKQNFLTGKVLYRNIGTYNALAETGDSIALSKELNIPIGVAGKIKDFSISHSANRNVLMEEYIEFQKQTDSLSRTSYEEYVLNRDLENFPIQSIRIHSKDPSVYNDLSNSVLDAILSNKYFEKLKKDETGIILRKKALLTKLISESDTLQSSYFTLLKNYYGIKDQASTKSTNSTINLNLDNKKDRIDTKEYDLFTDSKALKIELNEVENRLKEKEDIFILQKDFASPSLIENRFTDTPLIFAFAFALLAIIILFIKELGLMRALDKYGTKEKLLERE